MPVEKKIATPLTICWLRRDLRLHDNRALQAAITSGNPVLCLFIFDKSILDPLPANDARVSFIHAELLNIKQQLEKLGSSLLVVHDHVLPAWESICNRFDVKHVVVARDYEPSARKRDQEVYDFLTPK
ncbi:MAG: deoxyribodipyrimidine photo-lyase, partial [Flavobacteriales bacterium]|nr:deoxyribodipyrimidine photo-lyase [Flavobacteriales bacterium]